MKFEQATEATQAPEITPATMTDDDALRIIGGIVDWYMHFECGLKQRKPAPAMPTESLEVWLAAARRVDEINARPAVEGIRTIHCTVDERYLAALYVLREYSVRRTGATAVAQGPNSAMFVIGRGHALMKGCEVGA